MLAVISPAKSLNEDTLNGKTSTQPYFPSKSLKLINKLKKESVIGLERMMHISKPLAKVNKDRYNAFEEATRQGEGKPALFLYNGDVYRALEVSSLSDSNIEYAQHNLRILSGLYGLLKPMDKIQPHRLEMGTTIKVGRHNNLYKFWGATIAQQLEKDARSSDAKVIVNLASDEYWKSVDTSCLTTPVVKVTFKETRNGQLKVISFNAKRARGLMARYIIDNQCKNIEDLYDFRIEDYKIKPELSTDDHILFIR